MGCGGSKSTDTISEADKGAMMADYNLSEKQVRKKKEEEKIIARINLI
jgi:hypothetical protein